ncbi:NAD(P)-binding domain-containing protein, partial [Salmonella enterica]|uniref:NAD(P)-binding domain-containing protein n=1 Tax=Salmonella enterica TaxID=28901 RepID=UPI000648B37F
SWSVRGISTPAEDKVTGKRGVASAKEFAGVGDALVILGVNAAQVRKGLFGGDGVAHLMKPGSAVMGSSTISNAGAPENAAALA